MRDCECGSSERLLCLLSLSFALLKQFESPWETFHRYHHPSFFSCLPPLICLMICGCCSRNSEEQLSCASLRLRGKRVVCMSVHRHITTTGSTLSGKEREGTLSTSSPKERLVNLLRRSLTVVIRRWWSEDTSAPLITRTSHHDLLNLRLMHMWSIWFSVTWFGDSLHYDAI